MSKKKLPDEIIPIKNPDKLFHEKWTSSRNKLNIPHPYRCILMGRPNSGKSTVIKNLLLRAEPPFEEIFVIHPDAEFTKEYDDLKVNMLSEIPAPEEWQGENKTLVILDDLEFKGMGKEQKRNLDRLFGYVSTHKNISCCLAVQDAFSVFPAIKRCSNLLILWRGHDLDSVANIARKSGLKRNELNELFTKFLTEKRDSLWLDMTNKTPYPIRKNGFQLINKKT